MNKTSGVNCLADIFPFLTDLIVDNDDVCVENVIDSLYDYGSLHGSTLQNKVEQSPFYTKDYKKISFKKQQQLRNKEHPEHSDDDHISEASTPPVKRLGKRKYNRKNKKNEDNVHVQETDKITSDSSFIGVSIVESSKSRQDSETKRQIDLYEAIISIDERKVNLGKFHTIEEAAHAYDRALIRANGPISCQGSGILNFPLSYYSSDALNKFSVYDTILRKQLFGSNWTGPKLCDFGFLITQNRPGMYSGTAASQRRINMMKGSPRKKRMKGQYSDPNTSHNSGFGKGSKQLLSGSGSAAVGESEGIEEEDLYFKSHSLYNTTNAGGKSSTSGSSDMRAGNTGRKKAPPINPDQMYAGDTVLLMHGIKERNHGRIPYERAILLDHTGCAGWLLFGLSDRTTRKMRGELVTILGACSDQMKYMRVPAEAVTDDDRALLQYFESNNMIIGPRRADVMAHITNTFTTTSTDVCNMEHVSLNYTSIYSMDTIKYAIERYKAHYQALVDVGKKGEQQDPVSLYTLADYKRVKDTTTTTSAAAVAAVDGNIIVSAAMNVSGISSSSTGTSTPVPQFRSRSSRFVSSPGSNSSTAVSNAPANFQLFTSGMFGHKMTDILAGASHIIPQELLLLYNILQEYHHKTVKSIDINQNNAEDKCLLTQTASILHSDEQIESSARPSSDQLKKKEDRENSGMSTTYSSNSACSNTNPAWLSSLLRPSEPDIYTALITLRTHILESVHNSLSPTTATAISTSSASSRMDNSADGGLTVSVTPSVLLLLEKALLNSSFEGVSAVYENSGSDSSSNTSSSDMTVKYTFDLPAGNKMLMTDLGITPSIVAAGLQENGIVTVGYFATPFEAALVREQVLGLNRSAIDAHRTYTAVTAKGNFTAIEWSELKRISRFVSKFTRKYCLP